MIYSMIWGISIRWIAVADSKRTVGLYTSGPGCCLHCCAHRRALGRHVLWGYTIGLSWPGAVMLCGKRDESCQVTILCTKKCTCLLDVCPFKKYLSTFVLRV